MASPATPLNPGTVIITAEISDNGVITTGTTALTVTNVIAYGSMALGRLGGTATTLQSGKVLVAGGLFQAGGLARQAELYDPCLTAGFSSLAARSTRAASSEWRKQSCMILCKAPLRPLALAP